MATLKLYSIVDNLHSTGGDGVAHHGDAFVVSVTAVVSLETPRAGTGISTIAIVVYVVVLDGNPRLDKIGEDDTAARRVPDLKAVYGNVRTGALPRRTPVYNAIRAGGAAIENWEIAGTIIAEGDRSALGAMNV